MQAKKAGPTFGNGVAEVNRKPQETTVEKSRVCRNGAPSYDSDHISCDLQEPARYLEAVGLPTAADFDDPLTEKGHERGMTWENTYETVVGGRYDGVGFPFEHSPLCRDYSDAHMDLVRTLLRSTELERNASAQLEPRPADFCICDRRSIRIGIAE